MAALYFLCHQVQFVYLRVTRDAQLCLVHRDVDNKIYGRATQRPSCAEYNSFLPLGGTGAKSFNNISAIFDRSVHSFRWPCVVVRKRYSEKEMDGHWMPLQRLTLGVRFETDLQYSLTISP